MPSLHELLQKANPGDPCPIQGCKGRMRLRKGGILYLECSVRPKKHRREANSTEIEYFSRLKH